MAILKAFKGWRPAVEIVKELASRPYDVLDSDEARIEAAGNAHSLLHVIKPEIDLPANVDPTPLRYISRRRKILSCSKKISGWFRIQMICCISMLKR